MTEPLVGIGSLSDALITKMQQRCKAWTDLARMFSCDKKTLSDWCNCGGKIPHSLATAILVHFGVIVVDHPAPRIINDLPSPIKHKPSPETLQRRKREAEVTDPDVTWITNDERVKILANAERLGISEFQLSRAIRTSVFQLRRYLTGQQRITHGNKLVLFNMCCVASAQIGAAFSAEMPK